MAEAEGRASGKTWFPFTATEVEVALGVFGFIVATASFAGVEGRTLALLSAAFVPLTYLAGLLVRAAATRGRFRFVVDGGLAGKGYVPVLRRARRSLLLTHLDDDPPGPELLGLYRELLGRGVQMRRIVFERPTASETGTAWIREFGEHPNLAQRVFLPREARAACLSFVVVDSEKVLVSVPGFEPVDADVYATEFVLRHLLVIDDAAVAAAFTRVHAGLWERARDLKASRVLSPTAAESAT